MAESPSRIAYRAGEAGFKLFEEWAPTILAAAERGERVPSTPQKGKARYYDKRSLPPEQRY